MQDLCLTPDRQPTERSAPAALTRRGRARLSLGLCLAAAAWLGLLGASAQAQAQTQAQSQGGKPRPTTPQATTPQATTATAASATPALLTDQAARWLALQLKMPSERITVQAPDPRWTMPQCPAGPRFDTPFSNANTIRVRCEAPQWQIFLRAHWPEENTAAISTAPPTPIPARAEATAAPAFSPRDGGRAQTEPRRAVMLTRAVGRGSLLSPASVEPTQVPAREADPLFITDAQFLDQMEAVRDLPAGVPLRQTDIRPAVLVRQGQPVTMTVGQGTGFTITVRLEALQDGRLGDRVMLRNSESGRTVSGVVTGMNTAKGA